MPSGLASSAQQSHVPQSSAKQHHSAIFSATGTQEAITAPLKVEQRPASAQQSQSQYQSITELSKTFSNTPKDAAVLSDTEARSPLNLQKLTSLITLLKGERPVQLQTDKLPPSLTTEANELPQSAKLEAVEQLKSLVNKVPQQLPNMTQLTNPAQLAHLIAQFSNYTPLNQSSINLSSLGPLASALQLILGAKATNSGAAPSQAILQQMTKILKKGNAKPNQALTHALQMLGNLQSLKPLEDVLTSLSSHITLYQYQNLESNLNNQQTFYFSLLTREQGLDQIEGEVEQKAETSDAESAWRLTLLLPVGDKQKIKAVASLSSQNVELELVCSDSALLKRTNDFQQFLAERLSSLGFASTKITCSQGEIPSSLLRRPNQLVELLV